MSVTSSGRAPNPSHSHPTLPPDANARRGEARDVRGTNEGVESALGQHETMSRSVVGERARPLQPLLDVDGPGESQHPVLRADGGELQVSACRGVLNFPMEHVVVLRAPCFLVCRALLPQMWKDRSSHGQAVEPWILGTPSLQHFAATTT